jgi:hypothetical protein
VYVGFPEHYILSEIPSLMQIADMKRAIEKKRKIGKLKVKLVTLFPDVPPASWTLVRWYVYALNGMYAYRLRCSGSSTLA